MSYLHVLHTKKLLIRHVVQTALSVNFIICTYVFLYDFRILRLEAITRVGI